MEDTISSYIDKSLVRICRESICSDGLTGDIVQSITIDLQIYIRGYFWRKYNSKDPRINELLERSIPSDSLINEILEIRPLIKDLVRLGNKLLKLEKKIRKINRKENVKVVNLTTKNPNF